MKIEINVLNRNTDRFESMIGEYNLDHTITFSGTTMTTYEVDMNIDDFNYIEYKMNQLFGSNDILNAHFDDIKKEV